MTNVTEGLSAGGWGAARAGPSRWHVERLAGDAGALHTRALAARRSITFCSVPAPALVLGSTQPASHVRTDAGLAVVRRRSGGGAVLVGPGDPVWVDVVIPRGDPLWHEDVGVAFHWLGRVWAKALSDLGERGAAVHTGPLVSSRWSRHLCFAGLGPGEVTVARRKVVGIAQRRTRDYALFQSAVPLEWRVDVVLAALALTPEERRGAAADLAAVAQGLPGATAEDVEAAFLGALAALTR